MNVAINATRTPSLNVGTGIALMSSMEIVDFINAERQEIEDAGGKKFVKLTHDNFLKKVPNVLGDHAVNFYGMIDIEVGNGAVRKSPAYLLPKREAALMAMSYSYKIQAHVIG
ncbi:hypothetical protein [Pseudomonas sp. CCC2.2]|uniref:hypothetical protein n=1 Tax=Pseudomonas sp. CCC2.2 TaxID=3048605 RepID=UPI002B22FE2A|nr:hypothetical protein [Pseudomonas sp. CCC2.2]MEB0149044.1 hypothetical protein [Pseudomonas sp. CCC2.2]